MGGVLGIGFTQLQDNPNPESSKKANGLTIEGYPVEGLSIGGHETCVIFPSLNLAFDIGRCSQRAISQDFVFISHAHMDHIVVQDEAPNDHCTEMYKRSVEALFEAHRKLDESELKHNLIGLVVGEEIYIRKDLKVKAFRTYHRIPSQGYIVYSIKQKLKEEYLGQSGTEIKKLRSSKVEVTNTVIDPQVAFTGDTTSNFIVDSNNTDVPWAKILVMESTFLNESITVEQARDFGHLHLSEIINHAEKFKNKAILLIHFSARYTVEEIEQAVSALPPPLAESFYTNRRLLIACHSRIVYFMRSSLAT